VCRTDIESLGTVNKAFTNETSRTLVSSILSNNSYADIGKHKASCGFSELEKVTIVPVPMVEVPNERLWLRAQ
jgi:hypothetical protein